MKYFNFILAATIVAESCSAGNFPEDGWGSSYLKDIPKAIAYVKAHASELTVDPPPSTLRVPLAEYTGREIAIELCVAGATGGGVADTDETRYRGPGGRPRNHARYASHT